MNRATIRREVGLVLADRGWSRARYWWTGCSLQLMPDGPTGKRLKPIRILSGISRKRFLQAMEGIETIGSSRPAPQYERADTMRQLDLEDAIGESRR